MIELSIVMPCLNEAETLEICILKAKKFLTEHQIGGEVIIGDNGSTDGSQQIAKRQGARVIDILEKGYGSALIGAINAAKGKYVIMGDSDDSYDFENLMPFVEKLREGYDLVMGNRFKGGIKKGAMPFLHYYLGNPVLSFIGKLFFKCPINDFHCGLRGFKQDIVDRLNLRTTGMEFASEMVVKSSLFNLKLIEVPTILYKDGRSRPPHLKTWRDGWRHLRFLLIYAPSWLFLYPGFFLICMGLILHFVLAKGAVEIFGTIQLDTNTLLYASAFLIIGFQAICFGVFTKLYAIDVGFLPKNEQFLKLFRYINLELGLIFGVFLIVLGVFGTISSFLIWGESGFGVLDYSKMLHIVIPSVVAVILGFQTVLASFFLGVLGIKKK